MAKRIPAGMMRHRVKIQRPTTGLNAYGQASTTGDWCDVYPNAGTVTSLPAMIKPLSGREAELARQVYPLATHEVVLDYLTTMDTTGATQNRLLFGTRKLHIGAVLNVDEESVYHKYLCSEEK